MSHSDHFGIIHSDRVYVLSELMEVTGIRSRKTWDKMFKAGLRKAKAGGKIQISGRNYQLFIERASEGDFEWDDGDDDE